MPANTKTLAADFAARHIGPSPSDVDAMLTTLGVPSLDALIGQTVPASIRHPRPLEHGPVMSEVEVLTHMREIAAKNQIFTSFIGMGYVKAFVSILILLMLSSWQCDALLVCCYSGRGRTSS